MNKFPDCPKILKTENYDKFKFIEWNRSIDETNYKKLVNENLKEFQLHKFPILVTEDFKIIDGQHRFEVSKALSSPVYYIVDKGNTDSFQSVHSVNKAGKKHTLKDKLEMLNKAGDKGAREVFKVYKMFNEKFDLGALASILSIGSNGNGTKEMIDNYGTISLKNYSNGIVCLNALHNSVIPNKYKVRCMFALFYICKENKIDPQILVNRIEKNLIKWIEPRSVSEAKRVMINCYNFGLPEKSKIKEGV